MQEETRFHILTAVNLLLPHPGYYLAVASIYSLRNRIGSSIGFGRPPALTMFDFIVIVKQWEVARENHNFRLPHLSLLAPASSQALLFHVELTGEENLWHWLVWLTEPVWLSWASALDLLTYSPQCAGLGVLQTLSPLFLQTTSHWCHLADKETEAQGCGGLSPG